jgi:hypothetical protein
MFNPKDLNHIVKQLGKAPQPNRSFIGKKAAVKKKTDDLPKLPETPHHVVEEENERYVVLLCKALTLTLMLQNK